MNQTFYKTDKGIVVKDNDSIRVKSSFKKTILTEEEFNNSNPIKISKHKYLEELNTFFKNTKFEWEHNGTKFKKLDNFEMNSHSVANYNLNDIPRHGELIKGIGSVFIVMYHGQLYYTFLSGNYFPQMQLFDFFTKQLTSKWTNIKNLAPVMNKDTKQII